MTKQLHYNTNKKNILDDIQKFIQKKYYQQELIFGLEVLGKLKEVVLNEDYTSVLNGSCFRNGLMYSAKNTLESNVYAEWADKFLFEYHLENEEFSFNKDIGRADKSSITKGIFRIPMLLDLNGKTIKTKSEFFDEQTIKGGEVLAHLKKCTLSSSGYSNSLSQMGYERNGNLMGSFDEDVNSDLNVEFFIMTDEEYKPFKTPGEIEAHLKNKGSIKEVSIDAPIYWINKFFDENNKQQKLINVDSEFSMTKNEQKFSILVKNDIEGEMICNISYEPENNDSSLNIKTQLEFVNKVMDEENDLQCFGESRSFQHSINEALKNSNIKKEKGLNIDVHYNKGKDIGEISQLSQESFDFDSRIYAFEYVEGMGSTFSILDKVPYEGYKDLSLKEFNDQYKTHLITEKLLKMNKYLLDGPKLCLSGEFSERLYEYSDYELALADYIDKGQYEKELISIMKKSLKGISMKDLSENYLDTFTKKFNSGIELNIDINEYSDIVKDGLDFNDAINYSSIKINGEKYYLRSNTSLYSDDSEVFVHDKVLKGIETIKEELKNKNKLKIKK